MSLPSYRPRLGDGFAAVHSQRNRPRKTRALVLLLEVATIALVLGTWVNLFAGDLLSIALAICSAISEVTQ